MAKKDFGEISTEARLAETISTATAKGGNQRPATEEEMKLRKEKKRTKGRKSTEGSLPDVKINVSFTEKAYDFVKVVSKASGQHMSEFVLAIVEKYMIEHPEDYQKAKELQEHLKPLIPSTKAEEEEADEDEDE